MSIEVRARVMAQYFAQDQADRLDQLLIPDETLAAISPTEMVPMIRNILGGFLFSGDDVYKRASVLSGGERTRLAVARMLLRPSNTLLLDEPTNHLDLDSKDVLLGALADFGGTIIFVSHDRYFLDRLATKVVDVGGGEAVLFPGTYEEFHDRKTRRDEAPPTTTSESKAGETPTPKNAWEEQKRAAAEARKRDRAVKALQARVAEIESQIGRREQEIKDLTRRSRNQKGCVSAARESVRPASRAWSVEGESVLPSHPDRSRGPPRSCIPSLLLS